MSELEKLKNYLDEHGYVSRWHDVLSKNDQIIVYTENVYDWEPEFREPWHDLEVDGKQYIRSWDDGTKTVVKCQDGDTFDKEKGVALCFMKKSLGNRSNFNKIFKKYLEEEK